MGVFMTRNQRRKTGLALVCFLVAGIVSASDGALSLQDCLELAHEQNPLLLAAQQRQLAVEARALQAHSIPQLSLDYDSDMQEGVVDVTQPGETYLGLSTTVEFPGRRSLRIDIAESETTEGRARLATARQDLTLGVKTAFFELLLERKTLEFAEKNLELTDQFVELARARFETGDVAEVEVKRAQVEQAGAASALRTAENTAELAEARLALLIGRDCSEPLFIQESFPRSRIPAELATLTERAYSSRAEVVELTTAIERETLAEKQAHRGRLPDFDLGVARHWIDGEGSFWDVTPFSAAAHISTAVPGRNRRGPSQPGSAPARARVPRRGGSLSRSAPPSDAHSPRRSELPCTTKRCSQRHGRSMKCLFSVTAKVPSAASS